MLTGCAPSFSGILWSWVLLGGRDLGSSKSWAYLEIRLFTGSGKGNDVMEERMVFVGSSVTSTQEREKH